MSDMTFVAGGSQKPYLTCYAYAAFKFNLVAAALNFKISNSPL
nr:hypothetical protein [uncultured Campylobacter sp.]